MTETPESILGKLALHHHHELEHQQRNAWLIQIEILKEQLSDFAQDHLFFELFIPRMGKPGRIHQVGYPGGNVRFGIYVGNPLEKRAFRWSSAIVTHKEECASG